MSLLERLKKEYGEEYDFSKTDLAVRAVPVTVTCPDHGDFEITLDNLIYNAGCYRCRGVHPRGYPKSKQRGISSRWFYIHSTNSDFIKIGVTVDDPNLRLKRINNLSPYEHSLFYKKRFDDGKVCDQIEQLIKRIYPCGVASIPDGSTETIEEKYLQEIIQIVDNVPTVRR